MSKIVQGYVSSSIIFFKPSFMKKYKLIEYTNPNKPCIFFGCYNNNDLNIINSNTSLKIVIFGGSDTYYKKNNLISNTLTILKKIPNIFFISISNYITNDLNYFNIKHLFLPVLPFNNLKINPLMKGPNIYIYTNPLDELTYGSNFYYKLISDFKDIKFIIATSNKTNSNTKIKYYHKSELNKVYSSCFLGIRLTQHDGLSNTVQEMGLLGIKTIHNGNSPACINYSNYKSIVQIINEERKKIGTIDIETANNTYKFLNIKDEWLNINYYKNQYVKNIVVNPVNPVITELKHEILVTTIELLSFKLYGRTFIKGKVGKNDVWDAVINKDNILFYRIYKLKRKWILYIKQKKKMYEILCYNNNINNNVPPLIGWEYTNKKRV